MEQSPNPLEGHARFGNIVEALARMEKRDAFAAWDGHGYRCVRDTYANGTDLVSGAGTVRNGGRFTRRGGFATVYAATEPLLAVAETLAAYSKRHREPWQIAPLVIVAVKVRLDRVLDLTVRGNRFFLMAKREELVGEDWKAANDAGQESLCQAIGRAAHGVKVQALLVPSRLREDGTNIVLFPDLIDEADRRVLRLGE